MRDIGVQAAANANGGDPQLIRVVPTSAPATQPATGYKVSGELTDDDLSELEDLITRLTDQPILTVRVVGPGLVEVTTGVIRGPLDGGGRIFDFEKQEGRWRQINTERLKSWAS